MKSNRFGGSDIARLRSLFARQGSGVVECRHRDVHHLTRGELQTILRRSGLEFDAKASTHSLIKTIKQAGSHVMTDHETFTEVASSIVARMSHGVKTVWQKKLGEMLFPSRQRFNVQGEST